MPAQFPIIFGVAAIVLAAIIAIASSKKGKDKPATSELWPSPPWAEDIEKGIADMPDVREKYVAGLSITGGAA